jgi:hypothetical protein
MTTSIAGIQDSIAAFGSAGQNGNTGTPKVAQDSLALSETMLGLVKSQIDFTANITNQIVQSIPPAQSFSVYG